MRRLERLVAIGVERLGTVGLDGAAAWRRFAFFGGGVAGKVPELAGQRECDESMVLSAASSLGSSLSAAGWSSRLPGRGRRSERWQVAGGRWQVAGGRWQVRGGRRVEGVAA